MAKTQFGQDTQQQNAMAQRQRADKNKWEELIAMLNFAHKGDPQTMLGFGLGRLLRDGFNTWKKNYEDRGKMNQKQEIKDAMAAYENTDKSVPFEDFLPGWRNDRKMQQQDARTQAAMQNQSASDGGSMSVPTAPTVSPEMNAGQKGRGYSEGEGASALSREAARYASPDWNADFAKAVGMASPENVASAWEDYKMRNRLWGPPFNPTNQDYLGLGGRR